MNKIECRLEEKNLDLLALRESIPSLDLCGGYVSFEGLIRGFHDKRKVIYLDYEAYEPLAKKELQRISIAVLKDYETQFIRVIHRLGRVMVGQTAVIIQVLAPHRKEAFLACHRIIDEIKNSVPIWKKETYEDGASLWVDCSQHSLEQGNRNRAPIENLIMRAHDH